MFANKVVIVTGASSGIGASTAIQFAKEGADVIIVARNEAKLNTVASEINKVGKKPLIIKADVSKDDQIKTIVKKTIDKYGKLDVLVNNAGLIRKADLDDEKLLETYDLVVNTNLRSVVALTNLAVPYLIKTKGNIVNVSSVAGHRNLSSYAKTGLAPYRVSKAGVSHFSQCAALELAPKGVRVNAVSPGPVVTSIMENAGMDTKWDEVKEITALKINSDPVEIADLIMYLASDKAKSITGSDYVIDAGVLVN